jgi:hypothetical protein
MYLLRLKKDIKELQLFGISVLTAVVCLTKNSLYFHAQLSFQYIHILIFFSHFINISREWPPLTAIVNHHGEALFMNVMRLFGSSSSPSR